MIVFQKLWRKRKYFGGRILLCGIDCTRPLDAVRWAATIAQVVIPIFSQKLPACLAGLLLMMKSVGYSVILTNVRTLLLSFLPIYNFHISNGL